MRNLKKFKQFESKEEFISQDDIKDIFVDIIDKGFVIKFYTENDSNDSKGGSQFFDLRKNPSKSGLGYFEKRDAYGYSDLSKIKSEFDVFDILEDIKNRLNSMGYIIGFEFEFNLSDGAYLIIVCHMQHSTLDDTHSDNEPEDDDGVQLQDDLEDDDEVQLQDDFMDRLDDHRFGINTGPR